MVAKSKSMARKIEKGNVRLNPIKNIQLGGGFKDFLFSSLPGEMIQFDDHIFQMGWNRQLEKYSEMYCD